MELGSAIRTEHQAREQTGTPGCGNPALIPSKLLDPKPGVFINDSFLRVGNDDPILLRLADHLVDLVADGSGFQIDRAAGVHSVCQDLLDRSVLPSVGILRHGMIRLSSNRMIVGARS